MADNNLNTGVSGGAQNDTGNPQTATPFAGAPADSAGVQPGTNSAVLNSTVGVPLGSSAVTSLNLAAGTAQVAASSAPQTHHNYVATGVSVLIFILAIGLIYGTFRQAKNTTD